MICLLTNRSLEEIADLRRLPTRSAVAWLGFCIWMWRMGDIFSLLLCLLWRALTMVTRGFVLYNRYISRQRGELNPRVAPLSLWASPRGGSRPIFE